MFSTVQEYGIYLVDSLKGFLRPAHTSVVVEFHGRSDTPNEIS